MPPERYSVSISVNGKNFGNSPATDVRVEWDIASSPEGLDFRAAQICTETFDKTTIGKTVTDVTVFPTKSVPFILSESGPIEPSNGLRVSICCFTYGGAGSPGFVLSSSPCRTLRRASMRESTSEVDRFQSVICPILLARHPRGSCPPKITKPARESERDSASDRKLNLSYSSTWDCRRAPAGCRRKSEPAIPRFPSLRS
jgi:hypothetical protein